MRKCALVSLGLPPSQSGQSVALYHLFKTFDPEAYCLVTQRNIHLYRFQGTCSDRLGATEYHLFPDYQIVRGIIRIASWLRSDALLAMMLKIRTRQIQKILVQEQARVVIACTGDLFDPPAAYAACRNLGIPFILYAFDYYSRQWTHPFIRSFAETAEQEIIRGAEQVIVPNECLEHEYRKRYGIRAVVIHNPLDLAAYEKNAALQPGAADPDEHRGGKKIIYTGAVYEAHYTAFRNLIAAMPRTGIAGLTLHIYTPQSPARLRAEGISGPVTIHASRPNHEMPRLQRSADILFLPLAFRSSYPAIIRTSAPAKIGEYLAAQRPVLVHAPRDSFIAWFFEKNQCGEVAGDDDPDRLAGAIIRLLQDEPRRREVTGNAYTLAKTDFDVKTARRKLHRLLAGGPHDLPEGRALVPGE